MTNFSNCLLSEISMLCDSRYGTDINYRSIYEKIKLLKLNEEICHDIFSDTDQTNLRIQCVKTLMKTELNYLSKIQDFLISIFNTFEKFSFKTLISKSQLISFYQHLPVIFYLHFYLREKIIKELNSTKLIGKILVKYLKRPELLNIYLSYIDNFADYFSSCQQIRLAENQVKNQSSIAMEAIIMMPIQRFPQLQLVIGDIFKNTSDTDEDKVNLYKSICLIKAISMCLDQRQKVRESIEVKEINSSFKKLKIPWMSKKIISKHSVFYLKFNFNIPRKIIKLPYYLLLCDQEVLMFPKDFHMSEIPPDMIFCYSFNEINVQMKNIFGFSNQRNSKEEFQKAKGLFSLVKDSFFDSNIINDVEKLLNDYNIMVHINEEVSVLNFPYNELDQLKISGSLLKLEKTLRDKERLLNNNFDSILNLKISKSESIQDNKIFLFDSCRQSNEWKTKFYRAKLSFGLNVQNDWILIEKSQHFHYQNDLEEFPLSFPPFIISENGIFNTICDIIRSQTIIIIIGTKISTCLWLYMNNGTVIILHFNYKDWSVLEMFQTNCPGPIGVICNFSSFNAYLADIPIDMEMWMSHENQLFSYHLMNDQRSVEKFHLQLPSTIITIRQIDDKMLVGLQSLEIFIFSQTNLLIWKHVSTLCLKLCVLKQDEELQHIFHKNNNLIYIVFKKSVAIYDINEKSNNPIQTLNFNKNITCFYNSTEGVWISVANDLNLTMYDKSLKLVLQTIKIPMSIFGVHFFGSITSIILTNKHLWVATEAGFIILIPAINRLFCTNSIVTAYVNSKYSGPTNFILPFQNIHGIHLKTTYQSEINKKILLQSNVCTLKRCISTPTITKNYFEDTDSFSGNCADSQKPLDDVDMNSNLVSTRTYENLRNNTPMLILVIGNGLFQFTDFNKCDYPSIEKLRKNEPLILTFLE